MKPGPAPRIVGLPSLPALAGPTRPASRRERARRHGPAGRVLALVAGLASTAVGAVGLCLLVAAAFDADMLPDGLVGRMTVRASRFNRRGELIATALEHRPVASLAATATLGAGLAAGAAGFGLGGRSRRRDRRAGRPEPIGVTLSAFGLAVCGLDLGLVWAQFAYQAATAG